MSASGRRLPKRTAPTVTSGLGTGSIFAVKGPSRGDHGGPKPQGQRLRAPAFRGNCTGAPSALYKCSNVLVSHGFGIDLDQRVPQIDSLQMRDAPKAPQGP